MLEKYSGDHYILTLMSYFILWDLIVFTVWKHHSTLLLVNYKEFNFRNDIQKAEFIIIIIISLENLNRIYFLDKLFPFKLKLKNQSLILWEMSD